MNHTAEDFDVERPLGRQRAANNNWGDDLPRALPANQFVVYSVWMMALARWGPPLLGLLSPGKLALPTRDTGLINLLGDHVPRRACADAVAVVQEVRRVFAKHISGQKLKLMALFTTCIGNGHDFSNLLPSLKQLGARHVAVTRRAGAAAARSNKGYENVARPRGNI